MTDGIFLPALFSVVSIISNDVIVAASTPNVKYRIKKDIFEIYKKSAMQAMKGISKPVAEDDVSFYFYTNENKENGLKLDPRKNLQNLGNFKSLIIFITHGWQGGSNGPLHQDLKNAFLLRDKSFQVIIVDWKAHAAQPYPASAVSTFDVAQHIGNLIINLNKNYGISKENFLLVGHSLGAHISGFVGKIFQNKTGTKLPRIVGLDPAGPVFAQKPVDQRLNPLDAEVVEVIHSNGGFLGFKDSLGTIDFFVNGGSKQPGCTKVDMIDIRNLAGQLSDAMTCDHQFSYRCYIEAIQKPTEFMAEKCESWDKFKKNQCDVNEKVPMGDITTTLAGNFYLGTNGRPPFFQNNRK